MEVRKELKDLTLLDRFLFAEAAEEPEFMENLLEIILEKELYLKNLPQTGKEQRRMPQNKQIRLDVWVMDEGNAVYDTEVQKQGIKNLPRRRRLYHGIIDSQLLPSGSIDFNQLNDTYVIMIMPFDLMGHGLYRYTFELMCKEVPGLLLRDGVTRIFLNTRGKNRRHVKPELIELLGYFEHTSGDVAQKSSSEKIRNMHKIVERIRTSEEVGVRYMQEWEERELARQEGANEQKRAIALEMKKEGMAPEQIVRLTKLTLEELAEL